jgi:hypothetical protein
MHHLGWVRSPTRGRRMFTKSLLPSPHRSNTLAEGEEAAEVLPLGVDGFQCLPGTSVTRYARAHRDCVCPQRTASEHYVADYARERVHD